MRSLRPCGGHCEPWSGYPRPWFRAVAQFGSALRSGRRGRWFKSSQPDFSPVRQIGADCRAGPARLRQVSNSVQANLALVRRKYELWNLGGPEPLVEHVWPPDVVFYETPEMPDTGVFRGVEAVAGRMHELIEAGGHFQMSVCSLEGRGEYVLAACEMSVEGAISGLRLRKCIFHVLRCGGGLVREFRAHFDPKRARREYERLTAPHVPRGYEPVRFSSSAISLRSACS
jgi:hypothetical protein